ncbi:MAG TPA: bifunctional phosphopantothenoylcysteine decarboxylase/phosphopantothenate--cysteine ligase CoaBC [Myxococcales bacterium]|nr:bifunctional phosphopantothenoylcysteine decarboxylase/phosphopantothenate--cysteine ligase CoaBC [Myxococcales bacterium]
MTQRTVVLGVGGGIAAYKACELVRRLRERSLRVRVAMTPAAQAFVTPLTFQALSGEPVLSDLLDPRQDEAFGHLAFSRSADLFVVAPATADLLGKLAAGLADDPVTAVAVAARSPWLLCPAMNVSMWRSPRVQANLATLRADPQVHVCGPAEGLLADGDVGPGRLAEVPDIVEAALRLLGPRDLEGIRVLVTAGPTREPLDPVRFLSNPSTGRMGFALAEAAAARGAAVTLVAGPVELPDPPGVSVTRVTTAEEMKDAALAALPGAGLVVAAAAVSDFRPRHRASSKVKKGSAETELALERTPDVLLALSEAAGARKDRPLFVGFAAETEDLVKNAREKLATKKLDLVVANRVGLPGSGFASTENEAVLLGKRGEPEALPRMPKAQLAHRILDRVVPLLRR